MTKRIPKYARHKASGQARVSVNGKTVYPGRYGSDASFRFTVVLF